IQEIVGHHFAAAQGGRLWTSPTVEALVGAMARRGAVGIGQSSWGPTGFAFAPSEEAAQTLYRAFVQDAKAKGLEILVARGRNAGAQIEERTPDTAQV
ncbi:MAG: GHMP kinase, partial [Hyphomicrobium sp.]